MLEMWKMHMCKISWQMMSCYYPSCKHSHAVCYFKCLMFSVCMYQNNSLRLLSTAVQQFPCTVPDMPTPAYEYQQHRNSWSSHTKNVNLPMLTVHTLTSYRNKMQGYGQDWSGSEYEQVVGFCKYGNEPSGYIKCMECLDLVRTY
jgi:hypothetical protein